MQKNNSTKPKVEYHECPNTPWVNWLIGSCAAIVIVILIIMAIFGYMILNYFFGIGGSNKFNLIENFEVKVEEKVTENMQNKLDEEINKIQDKFYNQLDDITTNINPWAEEQDLTTIN